MNKTTLLLDKSEVINITNEEFIRNMSKEELGDFLCSIAGRCKLCELRELCGKKYPKGYPDWLEDTYSGDITKGFYTPENSLSGEIHDYFGRYVPLGKTTIKSMIFDLIEKAQNRRSK